MTRYEIVDDDTDEVINTVALGPDYEYDAFAEIAEAQGYWLRRVG